MDELNEKIEEYNATGITALHKWKILKWFDQDRVSKTVWRNLESHLLDVSPRSKPAILESNGVYHIYDKTKSELLKEKT
ncbi:MAG: hypothetical protein V3V30_04455 [Parvularculaceae bacterium]